MQKRAALGRILALDSEIVLYDEPNSGLDPMLTGVIGKLILDFRKHMGIKSVAVTYDIGSAIRIADRMAVLFRGRVVANGKPMKYNNPWPRWFNSSSTEAPRLLFLFANRAGTILRICWILNLSKGKRDS